MPKLIKKENLGFEDGVPVSEMNLMPLFGMCSTEGAAKVVSCDAFAELEDGASIRVYFVFDSGDEAGAVTLNVNGTGAATVYGSGGSTLEAFEWHGGEIIDFVYHSEMWFMVGRHNAHGDGGMELPAASGWSGPDSAGLYYCTVENTYIAADSRVIISPIIDTSNVATGKAEQDAWNLIFYAEAVAGGIKFYAETKPNVAVEFAWEVIG